MPYSSKNLVEDYLGEEGVYLLTDDLASSSAEITRALEEADDYIQMYLLEKYDADGLHGVSWVERRATALACFFLFLRRGQQPPIGLAETFQRIKLELETLANNNNVKIPGARPRETTAPTLANYAVDDFRLSQRGRVDARATTNTYPGQPTLLRNDQILP